MSRAIAGGAAPGRDGAGTVGATSVPMYTAAANPGRTTISVPHEPTAWRTDQGLASRRDSSRLVQLADKGEIDPSALGPRHAQTVTAEAGGENTDETHFPHALEEGLDSMD